MGIAVQELLDFYGIETDHIAIRTSSYQGIDKRDTKVRVHGLSYMTRLMNSEDSFLIVDDVFDTGLSVQAIIEAFKIRCRKNFPHDVRVATAYHKPARNQTDFEPHFCVHRTDEWLVFPHEIDGLSSAEMTHDKPFLLPIIEELDEHFGIQRD